MFPHNKGLLRILWPDLRGPTARFMIHVSKLHDHTPEACSRTHTLLFLLSICVPWKVAMKGLTPV